LLIELGKKMIGRFAKERRQDRCRTEDRLQRWSCVPRSSFPFTRKTVYLGV
jgi:hypothetical protein